MLAIEELVTTFLKQFVRVFNSGGFENLCIGQRRILVGVYNVHSLWPIDTLWFFLGFRIFFSELKTERFLSCCCWCIFAVYFLDIKTSVYILFPLARLCRLVVAGDPMIGGPEVAPRISTKCGGRTHIGVATIRGCGPGHIVVRHLVSECNSPRTYY